MEEENYRGYLIKIELDEDPLDPRRDWDNLGEMLCFHKRYDLGDVNKDINWKDFNGWVELLNHIIKEREWIIWSPLYLYDHSGLRIKIGSFQGLLPQGHAELDSGQVGYIGVSRKKILDEYGGERLTKKKREQAEKILEMEVETYDDYLSDSVYSYYIEDEKGEIIDSCGGWYGYDSIKDAIAEAKRVIDYTLKNKQEEAQKDFYKNQFLLLILI